MELGIKLKFVDYCPQELEKLGAEVELADNPLVKQTFADGSEVPLPPIILGTLGKDPKKKTVSLIMSKKTVSLKMYRFVTSLHAYKLRYNNTETMPWGAKYCV